MEPEECFSITNLHLHNKKGEKQMQNKQGKRQDLITDLIKNQE